MLADFSLKFLNGRELSRRAELFHGFFGELELDGFCISDCFCLLSFSRLELLHLFPCCLAVKNIGNLLLYLFVRNRCGLLCFIRKGKCGRTNSVDIFCAKNLFIRLNNRTKRHFLKKRHFAKLLYEHCFSNLPPAETV